MTRIQASTAAFILLGLSWLCSACHTGAKDRQPSAQLDAKQAPADHFFLQKSYPDEVFPLNAYTAALAAAQAQLNLRRTLPPGFSETWRAKGPGNIGARVNAIAVHPQNEQIIYAGFSGGGLYKTTNGGQSWVPIFDDRAYLAIGAIALDPQNPEIVYVGTGDPNITGYPFIGDGLYRSSNGGQSWTKLGLEATRIISKIVIDPSNSQRIHVATMGLPFEPNAQRGLYRSEDGGKIWQQTLLVSQISGIIDLVIDPRRPNILFAAAWNRIRNNRESMIAGNDGGIYKSTDYGKTWTRLSGGLPTGRIGRIGLAFYAGNPDLVFAVIVDANSELQGIYRSADGGNSWTLLTATGQTNLPPGVMGGLGWYFGKIAVNPKDPNELFLLSVSLWKSSDGGKRWTSVGEASIHSDKHVLIYTSSGNILVGSDGGIDLSRDGGTNWIDIEDIPTTQLYRIDYNPHFPNRYYGGAQDHGTVQGEGVDQTWGRIEGGDGFQMRFHPSNPNIVWAQTQNGTLRVSTNGGASFQLALVGINRSDRVNWDAPLVMSKHDPNVLYTGTFRVYQNTTGSNPVWKSISEDLTDGEIYGRNFHTISCLHESPVQANLLMAGTSDGNVWFSGNQGQTWERIDAGLPERYVTAVRLSPTDANTLYVSHSGYKDNDNRPHLHISRNRGQTWSSLAGNLPPLAINDVLILPGYQDRVLFVATDGGVYGTIDAGKNWHRLGANLPIIASYSLAWNVARNELVVGTYGKSIHAFPLRNLLSGLSTSAPLIQLNPNTLQVYPLPFRDQLSLQWTLPQTERNWTLKVLDQTGRIVYGHTLARTGRSSLNLATPSWPTGLYWIQISDGRSQVLRKVVKSN